MSEWSDEACDAFWPAYSRAAVAGLNPRECMRAALTAADAVRKREAVSPVGGLIGGVSPAVAAVLDQIASHERRLSALEAARPVETSGYYEEVRATQELPSKPATERRCGTCRWWKDGLCHWAADRKWPDGAVIRVQNLVQRADEGTDCPTWEAEHV